MQKSVILDEVAKHFQHTEISQSEAGKISDDKLTNLLAVINEGWDEPIDKITAAQINDDGSIIAIAYSGDIPLGVKIDDEGIEVKPIGDVQFGQQPDIPDQIAPNLQQIGDPIFGGWLRQIEQMLATSGDLETAREALFELYPDLDSTDLTDQMTDAMALASIAGFWEAGTETADEAEFARIPEGTTRRRDGIDQVLKNSRWHNAESTESDVKKKNQGTSRTKPFKI